VNTPSHAIVNAALLERWGVAPALAGAVTPDVPIYVFYAWEKLRLHVPEPNIWRADYFASAWQPVIDALHSFPLIGLALVVAWRLDLPRLRVFSASLMLHALCDFPLHHDDAHRQLFPLSDWRFRSPISYWDPRHHGALGAGIETACVVASCIALARRRRSFAARAGLAALAVVYLALWALFYGLRR
jgi:hypothetical protein